MSNLSSVRFFDRTTPPHLITLIALTSLAALSLTLLLPSLADMAEDFGTDYRLMQLAVTGYLFMNGLLHVVIGPLSDRFGRRPITLCAIILFLLATLGCILAPNAEIFLVFRMSQAVIVTGIVLSRAIVRDMVPQSESASMLGYVTMGMAMLPMFAPALGGFLNEIFGWQSSFILLGAIGIVVFTFVFFDQGETAASKSNSFRQQISEYPELFRSRRFWGYVAVTALSSGSFFAFLGTSPSIGAKYFDLSPSILGFYFGLTAVGYALGNYVSGRFSVQVGTGRMLLIGSIVALACPLGALAAQLAGIQHPLGFYGFITFVGISNGIVIPNATAATLSVRPHLAGTASGIGGAIHIGLGSGIAVLAGSLLSDEASPTPYIIVNFACVALCLIALMYVFRVERIIQLAENHN